AGGSHPLGVRAGAGYRALPPRAAHTAVRTSRERRLPGWRAQRGERHTDVLRQWGALRRALDGAGGLRSSTPRGSALNATDAAERRILMSTRRRLDMRGEPHATLVRRASSSPRAGRRRGAVAGDAGRLLVRASAALDRSVRYEDTLKNIVTFAVPRMADYAALALPSDDGSLTWAAATHCNPDKEPLLGRLRGQGWRTGAMERMRAEQPHGRPWQIGRASWRERG